MGENEFLFQISVIILFCLLAVIGTYHRLKAAKSGEKITRQKEGQFIMIFLRLFGFSMWIGIFCYMINPVWMAWASVKLPDLLRWTGGILGVISIPLLYWMFHYLGKNITDTVVVREKHELVTSGPYKFIRHPMYLFSGLFITGLSLLSANWFIWVSGLLTLVILILRTPVEEKELIEKYGDLYREYTKNTGRIFPTFFRKNQ